MLKRVKKQSLRIISITAAAIAAIWLILSVSTVLVEPVAHIAPDYDKIDLVPVLMQKQFTESDYETLFLQTGLGKPAIDELKNGSTDFNQDILLFQDRFFRNIRYVCEKNSLISREEYVVDENGNYTYGTLLAPLHEGYILITKSSHTYGWRNGHAALVVDAAQGKTLESVVLGTNSCIQDIGKWTNYPNFMLLRVKGASMEVLKAVSQRALESLVNIPYHFTVGIFSPKFKEDGPLTGTHCSHLVWAAFRSFGYDLDSDGGMIVTPKDIANSPALEVVQVYGVNPREIWP